MAERMVLAEHVRLAPRPRLRRAPGVRVPFELAEEPVAEPRADPRRLVGAHEREQRALIVVPRKLRLGAPQEVPADRAPRRPLPRARHEEAAIARPRGAVP